MPLLSLPFDVHEEILRCLDIRDILVCCRVCKLFRDVVAVSLPTRFAIALMKHGMRDGLNRSETLAKKLDMLEQYRIAWDNLAWKEAFHVKLPLPCHHVYHDDGYILVVSSETSAVRVMRIPSPLRGVSHVEYTWSAPLGFTEGDGTVVMDSRHDLVVFLKPNNTVNNNAYVLLLF